MIQKWLVLAALGVGLFGLAGCVTQRGMDEAELDRLLRQLESEGKSPAPAAETSTSVQFH